MLNPDDDKEAVFSDIMDEIVENGRPIRQILRDKGMPSTSTFFKWLNEDEELAKRYSRACELRAELIFEKMLEVAENTENGEETTIDHNGLKVVTRDMTQHRNLKVQTYKWVLAKLNPSKFGDKVDVTTDGKAIETPAPTWAFVDSNKDKKS